MFCRPVSHSLLIGRSVTQPTEKQREASWASVLTQTTLEPDRPKTEEESKRREEKPKILLKSLIESDNRSTSCSWQKGVIWQLPSLSLQHPAAGVVPIH